ncbi:MAG: uncharacterized protein JWQ23_31 [Herminiimonas sp.]|nr:uncharacterized protein [Herminiimonas sp.]
MLQPSTDLADAKSPLSMSLQEVAAILVKHHGLHEGLYDLALQFQVAVGAVGPKPEVIMPGAMIGVSRIGIMKTEQAGPHTVDAAVVNPRKKVRTKFKT